jgi:hypothetical protein
MEFITLEEKKMKSQKKEHEMERKTQSLENSSKPFENYTSELLDDIAEETNKRSAATNQQNDEIAAKPTLVEKAQIPEAPIVQPIVEATPILHYTKALCYNDAERITAVTVENVSGISEAYQGPTVSCSRDCGLHCSTNGERVWPRHWDCRGSVSSNSLEEVQRAQIGSRTGSDPMCAPSRKSLLF